MWGISILGFLSFYNIFFDVQSIRSRTSIQRIPVNRNATSAPGANKQNAHTMSQEDDVSLSYIRDKAMLAKHKQIPKEESWGLFAILDPIRDEPVVTWIRRDYERVKSLAEDENMSLVPLQHVTDRMEDEGSYAVCINSRTYLVGISAVDE